MTLRQADELTARVRAEIARMLGRPLVDAEPAAPASQKS